MKVCPYCTAENRDDAPVCYFCGRMLPAAGEDATQPNRVRRNTQDYPAPGDTQPGSVYRPAAPVDSQGRAQPVDPRDPYARQPGDTQPYSASTPAGPAGQGTYGGPGTYVAQPYPSGSSGAGSSYGGPPYDPPPGDQYGTVPAPQPQNRTWLYAGLLLGLALLVGCGLTLWAISAARTGVTNLGDQVATRAAGVFAPDASPTAPIQAPPVLEPSPWPTFTPAPTDTPPPTLTPAPTFTPPPTATLPPTQEPTSAAALDKLLTPECAAALRELRARTDEVTQQPTTALDAAWREAFSTALDNTKTFCGTLEDASPVPGRLAEARQALHEATTGFDEARRLLDEGVQERSPAKLLEAGQRVITAAGKLGEALAILSEISP